MNVLSDSESSDSDTGRRFKTESTRTKNDFSSKRKKNEDCRSSRDVSTRSESRRDRHGNDRYGNVRRRSRSREFGSSYRRMNRSKSKSLERDSSIKSRSSSEKGQSRNSDRQYEKTPRSRHRITGERENNGTLNSRREQKSTSRRNSPAIEDTFLFDRRKYGQSDNYSRRNECIERRQSSAMLENRSNHRKNTDDTYEKQRSNSLDNQSSSKNNLKTVKDACSKKSPSNLKERHPNYREEQKQIIDKHLESGRSVQMPRTSTSDEITKLKKTKHKKHKHKSKREREEKADRPTLKEAFQYKGSESVDQRPIATMDLSSSYISCINYDNLNVPVEVKLKEELICGPSLPPHMQKTTEVASAVDAFEPKMPPTDTQKRLQGPSLPSDFDLHVTFQSDSAIMDVSDSEDDDFIGPLPIGEIGNKPEAHLELEKRALELKIAKLTENERKTKNFMREREEWMTELPKVRKVADLGLTARPFRTKERPEIGDRTGWTDTPSERERKSHKIGPSADELLQLRHKESEKIFQEKRDAEQAAAAKKHKKKHKRDESLLKIHQKKMKKQSEKEEEKIARRPFSRETDLKVNRFDEAQKKSILKKAQLLDTRFGSGTSKYL